MTHERKRQKRPSAKRITATLAAALILLATAGCATRIVTVKPECEPPPMPVLPVIPSADLTVDNYTFWMLMDRERLLADWALEMKAVIKAVCK